MAESTQRGDPFTTFCFAVSIDGWIQRNTPAAFFRSVSGLSTDTEVVPWKEGGRNGFMHPLIGQTKHKNIVLKRGFTADIAFIDWRWMFTPEEAMDTPGREFPFFDGTILQLNSELKPVF